MKQYLKNLQRELDLKKTLADDLRKNPKATIDDLMNIYYQEDQV